MSGVCAKHERYVPDGEQCPYCEPIWVYDVPMGRPLPEPIVFTPPPPTYLGLAILSNEYASIFGIDDPPSVLLKDGP